MTYKRRRTQEREKNLQKARFLRWRQQEDAEEADARNLYEDVPPPTATLPPPPTTMLPPPSPQPSTSSAPSTCTPPPSTPDTTPLPATEKTHLQLRKELLQAANLVTASPSSVQNTLVTATLDQLDTLMDKMRYPVRSCRSKITVTISDVGDILQTECKKCHTLVSSASPVTYHHSNNDQMPYPLLQEIL